MINIKHCKNGDLKSNKAISMYSLLYFAQFVWPDEGPIFRPKHVALMKYIEVWFDEVSR